jgi:hypothetical protein
MFLYDNNVSITEQDQGSLGRYILQSGRNATGSLRRSGRGSRSRGSHPCSILRLLAIVRRLTVSARRGREFGRSPREGQRTRGGEGLGLRRVGRMRLNTLHDEGYLAAQRSVCEQPSRSDEEPVSDCESGSLHRTATVSHPRKTTRARQWAVTVSWGRTAQPTVLRNADDDEAIDHAVPGRNHLPSRGR